MSEKTVTVGICTCGRPELANTLRSVAAQRLPAEWKMAIIVADNANPPGAGAIIANLQIQAGMEISHIMAPPYNISTARNAILNATTSDLLAFIDDDETAPDTWLMALIDRALATDADAVFGPVKALYEGSEPKWIQEGDFHSTTVTYVDDQIITGYSCNVLMRRARQIYQGLEFDPNLGRTGGEDTVFFSQVRARGGEFGYASQALIYEPVAKERASLKWLLKRRFRSGQTHGRLLLDNSATPRYMAISVVTLKAIFCFIVAAVHVPWPVRWRQWLLRGALHWGVLSRLMGAKELRIYSKALYVDYHLKLTQVSHREVTHL